MKLANTSISLLDHESKINTGTANEEDPDEWNGSGRPKTDGCDHPFEA